MRLLSSRIQPINGQQSNSDHVKQLLLKKISQKKRATSSRSSVQQDTMRFESLYAKLDKKKSMNR